MQFPDDADLDAALAPGQERRFRFEFFVDWNRNGLYDHVDSDLSANFESAQIERQPSGSLPDALEQVEGHLIAEMRVLLSGNTPSGVPCWKLFSPYSGLTPGTVSALDTPCYLDVLVDTAAGEKRIRQFTGVLSKPSPSRREGTVQLTCRDPLARGTARVNLTAWAADSYQRWPTDFVSGDPDRSWISLSWLITHCLRASGLYEGPPWSPDAIVAWSLSGSPLPDIGSITIEEYSGQLPWYFSQVPVRVPAGMPDELWGPSRFGLGYVGSYNLPVPDSTDTGALASNCHSSRYVDVLDWGALTSNVLIFALHAKLDSSLPDTWVSESTFFLEQPTGGDWTTASRVFARWYGDSGRMEVVVRDTHTGTNRSATYLGGSGIPDGWHHVVFAVQFTFTATNIRVYVDGVLRTPDSVSSTAAMTVIDPPVESNTNLVKLLVKSEVQYAQWIYQADRDFTNWTLPSGDHPNPTAAVDLAAVALEHIPRRVNHPALDLLREVTGADLGVLYCDEFGVARYDSRYTVLARRRTELAVRRLTTAHFEEFNPEPSLESVVNSIGYTTVRKLAYIDQTVYSSGVPDEHRLAGLESRTDLRSLPVEAQAVRIGPLTYQHLAMGYDEFGASLLWWERSMEYYGPDYWPEGFTPYEPGTRPDPTVQPVPVPGVFAGVRIGAADGDFFSGAFRLVLGNPLSSDPAQFSVDDSVPFLRVAGTLIVPQRGDSRVLIDSDSVDLFGPRTLDMPQVDWYSDPRTCDPLFASLLLETAYPRAYLRSMSMPGDPRTQVQDVFRLDDPEGMAGPAFLSVQGLMRTIDKNAGVRDEYLLATFGPPPGTWIIDDPEFSIMDDTTVVG